MRCNSLWWSRRSQPIGPPCFSGPPLPLYGISQPPELSAAIILWMIPGSFYWEGFKSWDLKANKILGVLNPARWEKASEVMDKLLALAIFDVFTSLNIISKHIRLYILITYSLLYTNHISGKQLKLLHWWATWMCNNGPNVLQHLHPEDFVQEGHGWKLWLSHFFLRTVQKPTSGGLLMKYTLAVNKIYTVRGKVKYPYEADLCCLPTMLSKFCNLLQNRILPSSVPGAEDTLNESMTTWLLLSGVYVM